jgi:hypothetical protein
MYVIFATPETLFIERSVCPYCELHGHVPLGNRHVVETAYPLSIML